MWEGIAPYRLLSRVSHTLYWTSVGASYVLYYHVRCSERRLMYYFTRTGFGTVCCLQQVRTTRDSRRVWIAICRETAVSAAAYVYSPRPFRYVMSFVVAAEGTSCGPPPIGPEQLMTTVTSRRSRTLRDAAVGYPQIHLSPTCSRGESHASPYRVATRLAPQSGTYRTSTSPLPPSFFSVSPRRRYPFSLILLFSGAECRRQFRVRVSVSCVCLPRLSTLADDIIVLLIK